MAYTSGIFYIDLVSGSDAARTALTSCTASNPSGSVTRINKTGHGLVTGAVVDLTLFTTWLNSAWKITVVDANNFDLDAATWQATADASGTVTPRGGSSWADAWLTTTSGGTAARIQPGDTMKYPKSVEVSAGVNATFTSGSKSITLASALTKTIEHAVSGWTASANITGSTNTSRKYGATATVMTPASGFTTGKVCYKAIEGGGTQDFSAYEKISLWFRPTSNNVITASTYKLCLCSDATGDTIVNEINLPATLATSAWHIFVLDYGAALSSSVQSVAIYANSDPGTTAFSFNNIVAANDVTHMTLIGWTGDCLYNIQAFDGTTVTIDSHNTTLGGQGWYGTNGTAALYYIFPVEYKGTGTANTTTDTGARDTGLIKYSGGWDTSSGLRDGFTYIACSVVASGTIWGVNNVGTTVENFVLARGGTAIQAFNQLGVITNCIFCGNSLTIQFASASNIIVYGCKFLNNTSHGTTSGAGTYFINCKSYSNTNAGFNVSGITPFVNCTTGNNSSAGFYALSVDVGENLFNSYATLRNCVVPEATEILSNVGLYGTIWSFNHDQTTGNHWGFAYGATINWQTSTVHDTEPGAWRVVISNSIRNSLSPVIFKFAEIAVEASVAVTVTAWVKKDHATNVACKIFVRDELYSLPGVTETSDTKASDTSWEQLSITFTPTEAGIVPLYFSTWYVAGNSNTYIGTITATQ